MARSHAIWLVCAYAGESKIPVAAFTVKHELQSWLDKRFKGDKNQLQIFRMIDNPYYDANDVLHTVPNDVTKDFIDDTN